MTAADPLAALGGTRRAYVLPELKILYISIAKNACTSVKWLLADLAGEDLSRFRVEGMSVRVHAEHGIHERAKWQHTPTLNKLPPGVRESIHPDNGWFVFAHTRDPRGRLFSAWQQKFLLREPAYAQFLDEPWHPRLPTDAASIAEDFARFVDVLDSHPPHELMTGDAHFARQTGLLLRDVVPYSRVYDVREMKEFTADLSSHLRGLGHSGEVQLPGSNDTPLRANALAYPPEVRATVERLYAADFESIDAGWSFDSIERADEWSPEAIRGAFARAELSNRFTDVRRIAQRSQRRSTKLAARVETLEARVDKLRGRARRLEAQRTGGSMVRALARRARRQVAGLRSGHR